jgi:putative flippase GtrA
MPEGRTLFVSLIRYAMVGLANTILGMAIILGLQLGLGVRPYLANAAGYAAGLVLGFLLNRRFVFASDATFWRSAPRYGVAALLAFAANQIVLSLAIRALGPSALAGAVAQVLAVACYTALFFGLCRLWIFRAGAPAR